jgi:hypothetical protein
MCLPLCKLRRQAKSTSFPEIDKTFIFNHPSCLAGTTPLLTASALYPAEARDKFKSYQLLLLHPSFCFYRYGANIKSWRIVFGRGRRYEIHKSSPRDTGAPPSAGTTPSSTAGASSLAGASGTSSSCGTCGVELSGQWPGLHSRSS